MDIVGLGPADAPEIAALWNRRLGRRLPLEPATLAQRLAAAPGVLLGARFGAELVGVAAGRVPTAAWAAPGVGHVALLAAAPEARGKGVGARLYRALAGRLAAAGARRLRFGGGPAHLLPGVPQAAPPATWRFLRRQGAAFGAAVHDLHLDLRPAPPAPDLPAGVAARDDDPDGALAFVARTFPGRWRDEVEEHLAGGGRVWTLVEGGATVAFFAVREAGDGRLGPSLTWRRALAGPVAGLGPLGVDPERRGRGLGLAGTRLAAADLRARGARDLVIDWTDLAAFYGRAGARLWRSYQAAEAPLPRDLPRDHAGPPDPAAAARTEGPA